MATLEQRNGWFRVVYRYKGEKRSRSLNTQDQKKADFQLAKLELLLRQLKLGETSIPAETDPMDHLQKKPVGKQSGRASDQVTKSPKKKKTKLTIRNAWNRFKESLPFDSLEESTLKGMATHVDHLVRIIGQSKALDECVKPVVQKYIDSRSKEPGRRGHTVSVQTIKKELRTLSTIWNWAIDEQLLKSPFPGRKLRYPKYTDKPPFQTIGQIRAKIERFSLTENQQAELWESVFLSVAEVSQVLKYVKNHLRNRVFYPMLCFVAYTGARRSEAMRSQLQDLDFENRVITIREKKRVRGRLSTRQVPMPESLQIILESWLNDHPGTEYTFADIKFGEETASSISNDQASTLFKRGFAKSQWDFLPGWHTFRHSFCSNCAAAGIEQRVINQWVGHQTDEMVMRYRHCFPDRQNEQINRVFGKTA